MAKDKQPEEPEVTERPYEEAKKDPEEIAEIENRDVPDQIADYHETHPTLQSESQEAAADKGEDEDAQG